MTAPDLDTLDKAHLLAQAFAGVAVSELEELAALAKLATYPPGYVLCREGAEEAIFYILAAGEAVITKTISPTEGERVLRQVGPGDYVGEMALIQNAPRSASVRTLTDCTVLEIDKNDFEAILSRSPRLALSIIRTTLSRMRANDQVAIHDLQRTNRILAQLDRNKLEFIEIAAHELRTPLTVMKGYLNVLRQDEGLTGDSTRQQVLDGLNRGTERLHEIVNTMLDVTRIDTDKPGGVRIAAVPVPLKSVINDIVRRLLHEAHDRRLQIDIEHAPETLVINADPTLVQKALYQVIVNAIKYTPDDGRILIRTLPVTMPTGQAAVQISVRDGGIGLDPEHHELIFEKFYQVGSVDLHSSGKTV
ncbi:MAG: cyclic nucleotide-binding domain-containing protein, partial [Anaerolineales bacterium]